MALSWDFKQRSGVISLHEFFLLQRFGFWEMSLPFLCTFFSISIGSCSSTVSQHSFDATQHPKKSRLRSKTPPKLVRTEAFQDTQNYFKTGPSKCWEWSYTAIFLWLTGCDLLHWCPTLQFELQVLYTTWEVEPPTYPPWSLEPTYPTLQKGFGRGYVSYQEGNRSTNQFSQHLHCQACRVTMIIQSLSLSMKASWNFTFCQTSPLSAG